MKPTWMMILMTTFLAACAAVPRASPELSTRRAQLIGWLDEYAAAGQYPADDAGMPRSVFVDKRGVRCPMAELIWRSGHPELVQAVAREHNEVRLAEVTEGPLHDWMLGSGLTMDEIALVQGVMDLNTRLIPDQDPLVAQARVRGRLETAVEVVKQGKPKPPTGKIPTVVVKDKVLPEAALHSRAKFVHN